VEEAEDEDEVVCELITVCVMVENWVVAWVWVVNNVVV